MPKSDRARVDYMPCGAAVDALEAAQGLYPAANIQALIHRLVITDLSALVQGHWRPAGLFGCDRDRWKLPDGLRLDMLGNDA